MRDVAVHKRVALEISTSLDEEGFLGPAWCGARMNPETLSTLLVAQSEPEVDEAFKLVYELLQSSHEQDDYSEYSNLLTWALQPEIVSSLHTDLILALLRLPYLYRDKIPSWKPMFNASYKELLTREESGCVERLLWGLLG